MNYYLIFLLSLLSCQAPSHTQQNDNKDLLNGKWVSSQDRSATMIINNDTLKEYYRDELDQESVSVIKISNESCDTSYLKQNHKNYQFLKRTNEDGMVLCYEILGVTDSTLSLRFTSRGNLLLFRKIKAVKE